MMMQHGEKVSLTPQSWIAFWGLTMGLLGSFFAGAYGLHISRMEDRERLIRVEMLTESTANGVQQIASEVKTNTARINAAEGRLQRLEDKGT